MSNPPLRKRRIVAKKTGEEITPQSSSDSINLSQKEQIKSEIIPKTTENNDDSVTTTYQADPKTGTIIQTTHKKMLVKKKVRVGQNAEKVIPVDFANLTSNVKPTTVVPNITISAENTNQTSKVPLPSSYKDLTLEQMVGLDDQDDDYENIDVEKITALEMQRLLSSSHIQEIRDQFNEKMMQREKEYNSTRTTKKTDDKKKVGNIFQSFSSNLTNISKVINNQANNLVKFSENLNYSSIENDYPLLTNEFYNESFNSNNTYTRPLNESYNELFGDVQEIPIELIQKQLGFENMKISERPEQKEIDLVSELKSSLNASRKKISREISIIDLTQKSAHYMFSLVSTLLLTGLTSTNFRELIIAVRDEIKTLHIYSALDNNMVKSIDSILEQPNHPGRKGSLVIIYELLKTNALSQFVLTISNSPQLSSNFYHRDAPIVNAAVCLQMNSLIEEIEASRFNGELNFDHISNIMPTTSTRFLSRFRNTMVKYNKLQTQSILASEDASSNTEKLVLDCMNLIVQFLLSGKNSELSAEIVWSLISSCANKEINHSFWSKINQLIIKRKNTLHSSATKFYRFIVDCFNEGLAPYILPLLSECNINQCIMLSDRETVLRSSFSMLPLAKPWKFDTDIVSQMIEQ